MPSSQYYRPRYQYWQPHVPIHKMVRADPEKNKGKLLKHELFEQRKVCDKLLHEIGVPEGYEPMTSRNHTE